MRALTLQQVNPSHGDRQQQQQPATCGRSLSSNYAPLSLENKLLAQTSMATPQTSFLLVNPARPLCSFLQPSSLSCTTSSLLFTPSPSSPLLSTQNQLLKTVSPHLSFSLTSSIPTESHLPASLASGALLNPVPQPTSFLHHGTDGEQKMDIGGEHSSKEISEDIPSSFETTSVCSGDHHVSPEEEEHICATSTMELPVRETDVVSPELDQSMGITQEDFVELDERNQSMDEKLEDKKYFLLNSVCCSLVNKNTAPGQNDWNSAESDWAYIISLAQDISVQDPEFILKVALYARQELNIRITSNFLLALAANLPASKPHVRRYFCAAVQLPSDWLEVVRIYSTCFSRSIPMCLKKAMSDKFKEFNEYQLAKYNTRKHRCKHNPKGRKGKKPTAGQLKQWANLVAADTSTLKKFMEGKKVVVVDKKQSEFSLKKMIKRFHIKEPAAHVMAILGKKYPADVKAFNHSGMKGAWDNKRAGQRMKLKQPETWEHLVSLEGNKAATWEKLIDNKSLPFMAMLRNLRNMISQGISEAHHKKIISRLTNKKAVIQSRQFPFRFLAAYKVIMELHVLASASQKAIPTVKTILTGILKGIPKSRRNKRLDWETAHRDRLKVTLGVPFIYQRYRAKKAQLIKANQRNYTVDLLQRYQQALETAVQISCRYNVPPLPGETLILLSIDMLNYVTWDTKQDFCLPPDPDQKDEEEEKTEDEKMDSEEDEEEDEQESSSCSSSSSSSSEKDDEENNEEGDEEEEEENGGEKSEEEEEENGGEKSEEEEEEKRSPKRRQKKTDDDDKLTPSMMEVAVLLSLMISSSAENSQLWLFNWGSAIKAELKSDVLLENVRSVMKQAKAYQKDLGKGSNLSQAFDKKRKIDNLIVIDNGWHRDISYIFKNYRKEVNNKALFIDIMFSSRYGEQSVDRNNVLLNGFSEQVLRFVAERGSSRLMDHVQNLDKTYNIPPPARAKALQTASSVVPIPASPKLRWQSVRVFVSSTFRDMHAERDILVRSVFPELRRRAASLCLYLQEVELRWGVTEEESGRAVELCLSEVCRCQMMVVMLGERYGMVSSKPVLPDLPQYRWLKSAPASLSVTEMEIRQFKALFPDTLHQRMFCFFRDPNITTSVPVAWRSDFAPESQGAEAKMASLKNEIRASDAKVTENYPCEWGGVVNGTPYLKKLEEFGKGVVEDLWMAVKKQFVKEDEGAGAGSDLTEQEVHQGALQRQFFGRGKLLTAAVEMVEKVQVKGALMAVEGGPGEGKTMFMAALAHALSTGAKSKKRQVCDVFSYSTAASQSACTVENFLRCLIQWFRTFKNSEKKSPLSQSYKDLLSEFHSLLSDVKLNRPLVLMVDGVDNFRDGRGHVISEWIPLELPQSVCLVISLTSKAGFLQTLADKQNAFQFSLGQLTLPDRKMIVHKGLENFGKTLSDSAFNNQLQTLIVKKGAVSPLYLYMACEDLRQFASHEKLNENLQSLPESLSQLVQHSLDRLCSEHRGMLGLRWALAALAVSPTGLRERDLYSVLNTCNHLSSCEGQLLWQEVLELSRTTKRRAPMATFTQIARSLERLTDPSYCHNTDDCLTLTHPEIRQAFEEFVFPTESRRARAHFVLAAHLWALADPQGTETFLHCESNSIIHLPSSLFHSGQLDVLHSLLSNYYFLYAYVRQGLMHHLLQTYNVYYKGQESPTSVDLQNRVEDCWSFVQRHAPLLSSCPALFIQQAFNEPAGTYAQAWAQDLVGKGGIRVVEWLNKDTTVQESSELVSTFSSTPSCAVLNVDGTLMVVGTGQGMLHVIDTETGQIVKSLMSTCDGVSSCVFVKDGRLATTSYDGRIELWDVGNGCRSSLIEGHSNMITASDVTTDQRHLVTVSLDFTLKVWTATKCLEVAALPSSSPMNCVTFDPEGRLLAAGCWNGSVIVWNWLQNDTRKPLIGHKHSVRSVSFSSSSSTLCSGSISGEVRVWSVPTSTCVGCFQAHSGATAVLTFLDDGAMLLSAGSDHSLQLWSGGLGRSIASLKDDTSDQEPPQKKLKTADPVPAALCVAIDGDYAAVGYHGEGIKLFGLKSGQLIWSSKLDVSVLCLAWVSLDAEQTQPKVLVSGGSDKRMRIWKREDGEDETMGSLKMLGMFAAQSGVVLDLAQNSTHLATASDDFTIALWLLSDMAINSCVDPAEALLRGHRGAVTCLAFSPDGGKLLSGGKDQALMIWDMNASPPVLSKSLPHAHKDWITDCAWTPDCVISSSNDGRLCLWDLQAGQQLGEISWKSPLTSVCCLGKFAIAGCAEGSLHVWNWETNIEICHIAAHKQRIQQCFVIANTDKSVEVNPEEMMVITASADGGVQLWKPMQMQHFSSFLGHSGAIHGVVRKKGVSEFLTVSEDCSLRLWAWKNETPVRQSDLVTALCFSQSGDLCVVGYMSGLLELWQHNRLVGHKQASDANITAICSMTQNRFAVSYTNRSIVVWRLVWNAQNNTVNLVKETTHKLESPIVDLFFSCVLVAVSDLAAIHDISNENVLYSWHSNVRYLGMIRNDAKSMWVVGENDGEVHLGFLFTMGSKKRVSSAFDSLDLKEEEEKGVNEKEGEEEEKEKERISITAASVDGDFVVSGDMKGNLWFTHMSEFSPRNSRKLAHSDRISALRITNTTIVSASHDRSVKLWDRVTKKQVGMFQCRGPVLLLEINPEKPTELVCADTQGRLYFLTWKE